MVPEKWYEQIYISVGFTPFKWRLNFSIEPYWGKRRAAIGPLWLTIGFPTITP